MCDAAAKAARRDAQRVANRDFDEAKDKVLLGTERRSLVMNEEDRRITAYHESGHALIALLTPDCDPVHKVTIIPRGMALGVTQTLPEEDRLNYTRDQIVGIIRHAMGGRAAEELVFNQFTTGASNDLEQTTDWAHRMVCKYGMSMKLGPVSFGDDGGDVFLGRDFVARKDYSESTAREIDEEVGALLNSLYAEAKDMLAEHRELLDRTATALLERETLDGRDLATLKRGEELSDVGSLLSGVDSGDSKKTGRDNPEQDYPGGGIPDPEPIVS